MRINQESFIFFYIYERYEELIVYIYGPRHLA
jgi:hypothetical protein